MLYYQQPQIVQSQYVNLSSDVSTTSTSFVDLTGITITMNTDANPLVIWFHASGDATGAANMDYRLVIDGTAKRGTHGRIFTTGFPVTASLLYREVVTVGSHTIKIQWKTSANTARIRPTVNTWDDASLLIEEQMV